MLSSPIDDILSRLHALQAELEGEIDRLLSEKRERFRYNMKQGRIRFERDMQALHRYQKVGVWAYLRTARLGHLLTAPVIYSAFIPFVLLDVIATFYQHICFRVYGIPRVKRADYFSIDRHHLAYLNTIEKINCVYCGYGNGLIEYVREISARTEQYWCPIKHARRTPDPHRLTERFVDYGGADVYQARLRELRREIATLEKVDSRVPNDGADG